MFNGVINYRRTGTEYKFMTVQSSNVQTVHPGQVFGAQTNSVTAALPNGGYVVAWNDNFGTTENDVKFQRYDGFGNAVGGVETANSVVAGNQILRDVEVTPDGRITIVWSTDNTVSARVFDGQTGAAISTQSNFTTVDGQAVSGAQLFVTGTNQLRVFVSSNTAAGTNTVVERANINSSTGNIGARTTVSDTLSAGLAATDIKAGNQSDIFTLLTSGANSVLLNIDGSSANLPVNAGSIVKVQENVHLAFSSTGLNVQLHLITGFGSNLAGYSISSSSFIGASPGGGSGFGIFSRTMLDLGDGRILLLWVGDTGSTPPSGAPDGIYGLVYNAKTGSVEGSSELVAAVSNTFATTIGDIRLDAKLMADGRVSVSYTFQNALGFAGLDTRSVVVDPDLAFGSGRTITGTALADAFVGSLGNDTFNDIGSNDQVSGNGGNDTVVLASGEARQIDLLDALRFGPSSGLTGIAHLVGGSLADEFHGNTGSNNLSGGGSDDRIYGREGNDVLNGDDGNDTLVGGSGNDQINGGSGNDVLTGGLGFDQLNGDSGADTIVGNDSDDRIYGGDGSDSLQGNAGDDFIDGGTGADFILGGAGADTLIGGSDNDTINGGDGDDIIDGGSGSDLIIGGSGLNVIDGGLGADTVSYAKVAFAPGFSGVYADLEGGADPFGSTDGFEVDDDVIINVENVIGSSGNDYLGGNSASNVLRGGNGDDILLGRSGADTMFGGAGADMFLFDRTGGGNDKVRDFTVGSDSIGLVEDVFGDINAGNIDVRFVKSASGAAAANGNAQLILQTAGAAAGRLTFDADGNGAGAAIVVATLTFSTATGLADFSATDFQVI